MFTKGHGLRKAEYAVGGPPITTKSRFLKTPDQFRAKVNPQRQDYGGKKDPLADEAGDSKSLKPIKPRK